MAMGMPIPPPSLNLPIVAPPGRTAYASGSGSKFAGVNKKIVGLGGGGSKTIVEGANSSDLNNPHTDPKTFVESVNYGGVGGPFVNQLQRLRA